MSELYNRIEKLCKENGINVTVMCKETGASRGSLTDLKSGRKKSLSTETISKIADYFNVTTDYLISGSKENPVSVSSNIDDSIKFALFGDADVDDEVLDDVRRYALIARQMREEKKRKSNKE